MTTLLSILLQTHNFLKNPLAPAPDSLHQIFQMVYGWIMTASPFFIGGAVIFCGCRMIYAKWQLKKTGDQELYKIRMHKNREVFFYTFLGALLIFFGRLISELMNWICWHSSPDTMVVIAVVVGMMLASYMMYIIRTEKEKA